jgi:hypothetical protein
MKVIIAGSREFKNVEYVFKTIRKLIHYGWQITEVVSGCAKGVDTFGEEWAKCNNIPIKRFPAKWDKYGESAGVIRNQQMVDYADALIAIRFQVSAGTTDTIQRAKKKGMMIYDKLYIPK